MSSLSQTNFAFLREHDEQLLRLGMLAESYFANDLNTCLLKLRQFAETLAQFLAARSGLYQRPEEIDILPPPNANALWWEIPGLPPGKL